MKRYAVRTVEQQCHIGTTCDSCGTPAPHHVEVVVSVAAGEEGGSVDEYDLCDQCLLEHAAALVAAGSRAPLVTGGST